MRQGSEAPVRRAFVGSAERRRIVAPVKNAPLVEKRATRVMPDCEIVTKQARCGKNDLDGSGRRRRPPFRNLLGAVMAADIRESGDAPSLLGAVA